MGILVPNITKTTYHMSFASYIGIHCIHRIWNVVAIIHRVFHVQNCSVHIDLTICDWKSIWYYRTMDVFRNKK